MAAGHARRAIQELVRAARALKSTAALKRRGETAACASASWSRATTFASLGMDFSRYGDYLAERRAATSARVCLIVYDVIPIVQPQFATIDFEPFILKILDLADHVLVISDVTRSDLESFAALRQRSLPLTTKLPLGSALIDMAESKPSVLLGPPGLGSGDFVLYVSTLTLRKNHHLLFDVWEELIREHGPDGAPRLVIAGQRGPLSTESQSRLDRTPEFKGVVFHVEEATDGEIAWLYRNCRFTVYPSLYEGWGLPVSESHDFGKVCLASNRTSLPEAAEGLAELLDPIDRTAWRERIWAVWNDDEARREHEGTIVQHHRRVTARHTTDALLSVAGLQDSDHVG
jgi:glycosyltransferase involved in cell wall biosynthesis